ncbi:MAG: HD domain-containing protein [Lachnospiraceae bacterium]|nr:HD domain-containing protein [Lachnospiraceae bacterium]
MERINRILHHPDYQNYLEENIAAEKDRVFCRHNMEHFLAVARIAMLLNLQENLQIEQEIVYAAAILHDIGRFKQYREQIPHELASAKLALPILKDCGFSDEEIAYILDAITAHRRNEGADNLADLLYRADKMSRDCFACPAKAACNWPDEKKNHILIL